MNITECPNNDETEFVVEVCNEIAILVVVNYNPHVNTQQLRNNFRISRTKICQVLKRKKIYHFCFTALEDF